MPDLVSVKIGVVPKYKISAALRRINLDVVERGISSGQIQEWATTTAFPHLRWESEIIALRNSVQDIENLPGVKWADTQIIYRYPDLDTNYPITYHVDRTEEGALFGAIYCVPLTKSHYEDGCLIINSNDTRRFIGVNPGDLIYMAPDAEHSSGINKGPNIRVALYFRAYSTETSQ